MGNVKVRPDGPAHTVNERNAGVGERDTCLGGGRRTPRDAIIKPISLTAPAPMRMIRGTAIGIAIVATSFRGELGQHGMGAGSHTSSLAMVSFGGFLAELASLERSLGKSVRHRANGDTRRVRRVALLPNLLSLRSAHPDLSVEIVTATRHPRLPLASSTWQSRCSALRHARSTSPASPIVTTTRSSVVSTRTKDQTNNSTGQWLAAAAGLGVAALPVLHVCARSWPSCADPCTAGCSRQTAWLV
jgi:hypothetical protein